MKVVVYSLDETESDPTLMMSGNVVPIRHIETCKILWEGNLDIDPVEGDILTLPSSDTEIKNMYVVTRIFQLDLEEPTLALFISTDDDSEYS